MHNVHSTFFSKYGEFRIITTLAYIAQHQKLCQLISSKRHCTTSKWPPEGCIQSGHKKSYILQGNPICCNSQVGKVLNLQSCSNPTNVNFFFAC